MSNKDLDIMAFIKGELSKPDSDLVAQEIESSDDLVQKVHEIREIDELCSEYSKSEIPLKRDLSSQVMSAIKHLNKEESTSALQFIFELIKNPKAVVASIVAAFIVSISIGHVMVEAGPAAVMSGQGGIYYSPNGTSQSSNISSNKTVAFYQSKRGIFSIMGAFALIAGAALIGAARSRDKTLAFVGFSALLITLFSFLLRFFLLWYFAVLFSGKH